MRFPWQARETRQAAPYSDAVIAALLETADGDTVEAAQVAAVEACAGLWGRGLASAEVTPTTPATAAVTATALELAGRSLLVRGEAVYLVQVAATGAYLQPACDWDVTGGADPASWLYSLTLAGPSTTTVRTVPAAAVVHVRYAPPAAEPWKGIGPLARIGITKGMLANLERRLQQDVATGVGYVLPVPKVDDALQRDIRGLAGKLTLVETTAGGWEGGAGNAPRSDYEPQRIGANPPESLETLREGAARHVFAACGVHPAQLIASDGTAMRESFRQFLHSTLKPVGRLVRDELRLKLNTPQLALAFDELGAADLTGRARAFQGLVNGGMDTTQAAALSGLVVPE